MKKIIKKYLIERWHKAVFDYVFKELLERQLKGARSIEVYLDEYGQVWELKYKFKNEDD